MRRTLVHILLFFGAFLFEVSFISSLSYPLSLFPLTLILSLGFYHEGGSWKDLLAIPAWGIGRDVLGLSGWMPETIVGVSIMVASWYVSRRWFTHRSVYGYMGLGTLAALGVIATDAIGRFFAPYALRQSFQTFQGEAVWHLIFFSLGMLLLSLVSIRFREQSVL